MGRYVFTMTAGERVVYYVESSTLHDRADAGLGPMGGSGYLRFWEHCKEKVLEFRELRRACKKAKAFAEEFEDVAYLASVDDNQIEAVITDLDYDKERRL